MTNDEPIDPDLAAALDDEKLTLWASPGLLDDPDRPDLGQLAVLALVPSIIVQARPQPGAELIDVLTSSLLGSGFGLLARVEPVDLVALPVLDQWSALLDRDGGLLRITEPDGTLYDGDLGPAPPDGWHDALRHRGRLIVIFATGVDIGADDRGDRVDGAAAEGRIVGAQLPLQVTRLS